MNEVGIEPSRDADSDLFGLDWGDDSITTINSVTERNRQDSWWKKNYWRSLIPVRSTMCSLNQCVMSILWRRLPKSQSNSTCTHGSCHRTSRSAIFRSHPCNSIRKTVFPNMALVFILVDLACVFAHSPST